MIAVHLVAALRWPALGWTLSALSAAGIVWLVLWIRSFARLPHRLDGDTPHLHARSLKHIAVPLDAIAGVAAEWAPGAHKAKDVANPALIAHPNRVIHLTEPMGRRGRIFVRLDDRAAFDAALGARYSPPS